MSCRCGQFMICLDQTRRQWSQIYSHIHCWAIVLGVGAGEKRTELLPSKSRKKNFSPKENRKLRGNSKKEWKTHRKTWCKPKLWCQNVVYSLKMILNTIRTVQSYQVYLIHKIGSFGKTLRIELRKLEWSRSWWPKSIYVENSFCKLKRYWMQSAIMCNPFTYHHIPCTFKFSREYFSA